MTLPSAPNTAPLAFDDVSPQTALDIPDGFRAVKVGGPFITHNGPL